MNYLIKTHRPGTSYKGPHTFVLSRGRNTGKLLAEACPNCWVIQSDNQDTIDRLEVIIHTLHMTKRLRPSLIGSVIEYIRIGDFRKTLHLYVKIIGWDDRYAAEIETIRRTQILINKYNRLRKQLELQLMILNIKLLKGK